jgi:hypothetical protein
MLAGQPFWRITIANADAAAYAYTDAAVDQGYYAVQELFTACSTSTNTGNPPPSRAELYLAGDMPGASRRLEGGGST